MKKLLALAFLLLAGSAHATPIDDATALVNASIASNGVGRITGTVLNTALNSILNAVTYTSTLGSNASNITSGTLAPARFPTAAITGGTIDGVSLGATTPGTGVFTSGNVIATNQFSVAPVGNEFTTQSSFSISGTTQDETQREFLFNCGFISNKGSTQQTGIGLRDKVCGYFGVSARTGTGDVWARNTLVEMQAGSGSSGGHPTYFAQGDEVDMANNNAPNSTNVSDGTPFAVGVNVTGVGNYPITAAIMTGAAHGGPLGHYGIYIRPLTADTASFYDQGDAPTSMLFQGTYNTVIDASNANAPIFALLKNGQFITAKNGTTGQPDVSLLALSGSNALTLMPGGGSVTISGNLIANAVTVSAAFQPPFGTPTSSSAACTQGQFLQDQNYMYDCTATNTWKRAALATF